MAEPAVPPKRLGERLVEQGLITPEQLRIALELQKRTGRLLGEILLDIGFVEESAVSSLFSRDMGATYMTSLEGISVDPEALRLVPKSWASEHKVLPLSLEDHEITVAIADPFDVVAVDELRRLTGKRVRTVGAGETDILRAIEFWYAGI